MSDATLLQTINKMDASSNEMSIRPEKIVDSKLQIHKYCVPYLNEEKIYILVIINATTNQVWVWIGSQEAPTFKYLSIAMQSRLVGIEFR